MKGVYIKGMEMPPEGLQETILLTHNKATVNSNRDWKGYKEFEAVSIQPHGDLIDRDALMEHLEELLKYCTSDGHTAKRTREMIVELAVAPTIIPASAEDTNVLTKP